MMSGGHGGMNSGHDLVYRLTSARHPKCLRNNVVTPTVICTLSIQRWIPMYEIFC